MIRASTGATGLRGAHSRKMRRMNAPRTLPITAPTATSDIGFGTLSDLIREHARRTPGHTALIMGDRARDDLRLVHLSALSGER